jgi:hypothetical protein
LIVRIIIAMAICFCQRHFHETWSEGEESLQVVNIRKNGLSELANIFQHFLREELGLKSPTVTKVCIDCLQQPSTMPSKAGFYTILINK